jgi:hypothetical protein
MSFIGGSSSDINTFATMNQHLQQFEIEMNSWSLTPGEHDVLWKSTRMSVCDHLISMLDILDCVSTLLKAKSEDVDESECSKIHQEIGATQV